MTRPHTEGHYWAKQTRSDIHAGADLSGDWEVVQTFDNGDAQFNLRVFVPGQTESEDIQNFEWGPRVVAPAGCES
ncbi:hypothetical protein U1872_06220 [Sphingomonas sp. RB3P16]|uniref:hypothetical protein n=1 Tax=Parasphingomonas frigoris TaxID=3096163 RepID=UPI002FC6CAFA